MPFDDQTSSTHKIVVCTTCQRDGKDCRPGIALIDRLNTAVSQAVASGLDPAFEVSGTACMAGCERPCTVAYMATGKASYLFGDVDPDTDVGALVSFAEQYRQSEDGWTRESERPDGLREKTLARLPGSLVMTRSDTGPVQ